MFKADKLRCQSQSDSDAEEVDISLQQAPERKCMNGSPRKEGNDADDYSDCSTVKIKRIELRK